MQDEQMAITLATRAPRGQRNASSAARTRMPVSRDFMMDAKMRC